MTTDKTQDIRAADVLIIGPLTIWAGFKLIESAPIRGTALVAMGAATILFNLANLQEQDRAADES